MDEHEADVKNTRIIIMSFACVAFVLITGVTSCVMHDDKLSIEIQAAETEHLKVQTAQEKAQAEAIKQLIDSGVNPISARCAIIEWKTERQSIVCASVGFNRKEPVSNIEK